jgi:hypothetical protein
MQVRKSRIREKMYQMTMFDLFKDFEEQKG